ncbi:LPS export ABC transporter periplasmic protein LptC [Candidatus Pelagibacter sp.]|uniref:LPS export ABC transporter periplasmic protein LptC n=1 Tax=Candidatus Pelagibacter sp. TaxID=2024849 RepID=UPI003F8345A2
MQIKKNFKFFFIFLSIFIISIFVYSKFLDKKQKISEEPEINEDEIYQSNIIQDIYYSTKDADGNEYIIKADKGEIDYSNRNVLYLTKVDGLIKLKNSDSILIESNFGKYNIDNFDTIFSKNVIINYLNNKITGEYLDFSLERNLMIISKNVIFNNLKNTLKADVIEIDIMTKDTKIFMYEKEKKVNIKTKNKDGNN